MEGFFLNSIAGAFSESKWSEEMRRQLQVWQPYNLLKGDKHGFLLFYNWVSLQFGYQWRETPPL